MFSIDLRTADSGSTGTELQQFRSRGLRKKSEDLAQGANNRDDKDYRTRMEETKEEEEVKTAEYTTSPRLESRFVDQPDRSKNMAK